MRLHTIFALLVGGCGGPIGTPVSQPSDDTATPVAVSARGTIRGMVTNADGLSLPGAHVVTVPHGHEATTDADGAFELPWLPEGSYALVVAAEGWQSADLGPFEVSGGEETSAALQLETTVEASLVAVTVLDADGDPLAGAVVRASTGLEAVADADGLALLEGLEGHDLTLVAEHPEDALWPRTLEGLTLNAAGGLQWTAQLAGRTAADAPYAGPVLCGICHRDEAAALAASRHARASVEQPSDDLLAVFTAGATVELGDATAILSLDGGLPVVTLLAADGGELQAVVMAYLGDPERQTVPVVRLGEQTYPLPFAWRGVATDRVGYPDSESALLPFEPERWFDAEGLFLTSGGVPDPSISAEAACLSCHSSGYTLTRRSDGGADLVYAGAGNRFAGVGCEACHGPASAHTTTADPAFVTSPAKLDPARADEVCGQCHTRGLGYGSGLPHPHAETERFLPGSVLADFVEDAGTRWPSGAAAQGHMQLQEHRQSLHGVVGLRCLDCHGVHPGAASSPLPSLLRLTSDDNALCEACHLGGVDDRIEAVVEHSAHGVYQPAGPFEAARCTGCHMAPTATDFSWSAASGAGDRSSHLFTAASPAATLEVFDAAGATVLEPGSFPVHACSDCHAWNAWYWEDVGSAFFGPAGDPTLLTTHEAYLESWEELYP